MSDIDPAKTAKIHSTVQRQLEAIVSASFTALNTQNFDTTTPPWTSFSKHFRNEPNGPAPNLETYTDYPILSRSEVQDLAALLKFFQTLYATCPGYRTVIVDMATTELDLEEGRGSVLVEAESLGIPVGVARPSMSLFEFRRERREWLCVRQRTLPGIEYVRDG